MGGGARNGMGQGRHTHAQKGGRFQMRTCFGHSANQSHNTPPAKTGQNRSMGHAVLGCRRRVIVLVRNFCLLLLLLRASDLQLSLTASLLRNGRTEDSNYGERARARGEAKGREQADPDISLISSIKSAQAAPSLIDRSSDRR